MVNLHMDSDVTVVRDIKYSQKRCRQYGKSSDRAGGMTLHSKRRRIHVPEIEDNQDSYQPQIIRNTLWKTRIDASEAPTIPRQFRLL